MDRELPISPWPEWKIISKAGEGSYGRVYKAERSEHGHSFFSAIKIISIPESREELNSVLSETGDEEAARQYFENVMEECLREISTMENFRGNSYVVAVEDFKVVEYLDEIGWDIFIRMEYLQSFQDYLSGKSFDEQQTLKLGIDLCRALSYCEKLHIIHRDIKPENIFVSRFGDFKLGDFGIAREMEKSVGGLSKKGTSSYMAPEMYHGEPCDKRVDIYSLGLVLYRLCNKNRLPFLSLDKQLITYKDKENAMARRMAGEEMPLPCDAGGRFGRVILKACAYEPDDRYRNASGLLHDLEEAGRELRDGIPGAYPGSVNTSAGKAAVKEAEPEDRDFTDEEQGQTGSGRPEPEVLPDKHRKRRKSGASGREESGSDAVSQIKRVVPWVIAVVMIVVIASLVVGFFLKRMLEDAVREQAQQMIASLQDKSEVSTEGASLDFATSLDLISTRATTIVDELPGYRREGTEGECLKYYNDEGELRKVLVYPAFSEDNVYEEYYYWDGNLFFAYIWYDNREELFYYRDGILIRWIDADGNIHDEEYDNTEYDDIGDKYWFKAVMQMADQG